jgi:SPP1 gp7 family putative phage head morphogenesis protein
MAKEVQLRPIRESTDDYDRLEAAIRKLFRDKVYLPLLKSLDKPENLLSNSRSKLAAEVASGRITYDQGRFQGRFSASISKELKDLGARWDKTQGSWIIPRSSLSFDVRSAIDTSLIRFEKKLEQMDRRLAAIVPHQLAEELKSTQYFDTALWKVDQEFRSTLKAITVAPQLTPAQRQRIAEEWQDNLRLWIKDFTQAEIQKLRKDLQKSAMAGNRYESAVKTIQRSYGVTERKAKFLARQETSLLMTKHKQVRYEEAGVKEYRWRCVAGSKNHPVRPWHKALEGKVFRWDNPPITTEPGQPVRRNNPGQDYNCRCFAQPIVKFK